MGRPCYESISWSQLSPGAIRPGPLYYADAIRCLLQLTVREFDEVMANVGGSIADLAALWKGNSDNTNDINTNEMTRLAGFMVPSEISTSARTTLYTSHRRRIVQPTMTAVQPTMTAVQPALAQPAVTQTNVTVDNNDGRAATNVHVYLTTAGVITILIGVAKSKTLDVAYISSRLINELQQSYVQSAHALGNHPFVMLTIYNKIVYVESGNDYIMGMLKNWRRGRRLIGTWLLPPRSSEIFINNQVLPAITNVLTNKGLTISDLENVRDIVTSTMLSIGITKCDPNDYSISMSYRSPSQALSAAKIDGQWQELSDKVVLLNEQL